MYSMLIVDDSPNDRRGITGLINWEQEHIKVVGTAVNGEDGYQKALELKPDFVLTDVAMPLLNGIEMTGKIKEVLPETRFVFMSCFDDVQYLQSAIKLEVGAYVLKPIHIEELVFAVGRMRRLKEEADSRKKYEQELLELVDKSLPLLQEQFLQELLYKRDLKNEDIRARMDYLKMDLTCACFCVVYIHIDDYLFKFRDLPMDKKHLLSFSLQKCVEETMMAGGSGYCAGQNQDSVILYRKLSSREPSQATDEISDCAESCIEMARSSLDLSITMGISTFSDEYETLPERFAEAEYAAKSKFGSRGNRLIFYSEVGEPQASGRYNLQDITAELDRVLESTDDAEASAFVDRYYRFSPGISEKYVKSLSYTIATILQTHLFQEGKTYGDLFDDELVVWRKLSLFETILDIRQFMINLIRTVSQKLNRGEAEGANRIVEDIKRIIDSRYASIENVNQVVEELYISPGHANALFKKHTGKTIFDWLTEKRVEIAKGLLKDPYVKIYEIPEQIGYKAQAHFRAVFKEYTGMTPKQYQENKF